MRYRGIGICKDSGEVHFRTKTIYENPTHARNAISDYIFICYTQIGSEYKIDVEIVEE